MNEGQRAEPIAYGTLQLFGERRSGLLTGVQGMSPPPIVRLRRREEDPASITSGSWLSRMEVRAR